MIDPEIRIFVEETERFYPPDAASLPLTEQRRLYDDYARVFAVRRPETVVSGDAALAADGRAIPLRRYTPAGTSNGLVLYAHGGGFMLGSLDSHDAIVARVAAETGAVVIAISYRLAPEHPAPAALEDVLAVLAAAEDGRLPWPDLPRSTDGYFSAVWMKAPFCVSYWGGRPTADQMLTIAYKSDAAWNETFWKRPEFDRILLAARVEGDEVKRKAMYFDLQKMISDDGGAVIPMFIDYLEAGAARVKGMAPHPALRPHGPAHRREGLARRLTAPKPGAEQAEGVGNTNAPRPDTGTARPCRRTHAAGHPGRRRACFDRPFGPLSMRQGGVADPNVPHPERPRDAVVSRDGPGHGRRRACFDTGALRPAQHEVGGGTSFPIK